eukprot:1561441-Prymnesium_polylepis.1
MGSGTEEMDATRVVEVQAQDGVGEAGGGGLGAHFNPTAAARYAPSLEVVESSRQLNVLECDEDGGSKAASSMESGDWSGVRQSTWRGAVLTCSAMYSTRWNEGFRRIALWCTWAYNALRRSACGRMMWNLVTHVKIRSMRVSVWRKTRRMATWHMVRSVRHM